MYYVTRIVIRDATRKQIGVPTVPWRAVTGRVTPFLTMCRYWPRVACPKRLVVNARSGRVQGERPWSAWKITSAVIRGLLIAGVVGYVVAMRSAALRPL